MLGSYLGSYYQKLFLLQEFVGGLDNDDPEYVERKSSFKQRSTPTSSLASTCTVGRSWDFKALIRLLHLSHHIYHYFPDAGAGQFLEYLHCSEKEVRTVYS